MDNAHLARRANPGGSRLDLIETPLAFASIDGTIETANRAFRAWTASDAPKLGQVFDLALPAVVSAMRGGKPHVIKAVARSPRGRAMQVEYQLRIQLDDGVETIVVEGHDLSRVHEKEAMLQSFAKTIEVNNRLLTHQKAEIGQLLEDVNLAYASVQRLLDSADQGFVTLDRSGKLLPGRSAAFDRWFGSPAVGTPFADCLQPLSADVAMVFSLFWAQLEQGVLPLELSIDMLPAEMRALGRCYRLSYKPELDGAGALDRTLVVISDVTAEIERERAEAQQHELTNLLARFSSDRIGFVEFVAEADALVATVTAPGVGGVELLRALHTLKGNCGLFGAKAIATQCHDLESRIAEWGETASELERLALGSGWRVLRQRISVFLEPGGNGVWIARDELDDLLGQIATMSAENVRRALETWAWESASRRLTRLGAQVRDVATRLGRDPVEVVIDGGGLRFDPAHWSPFWISLVHLVINSVSHGIEPAEQRLALGKSARAQVSLRTRLDRTHVVIEISDDGRGIDWPSVARVASQRGLDVSSPEALVHSLFVDGLSTRTEVDAQAGRGIGLAAVRAAASRLGGVIEVESEPGCGTMFRFRFAAVGVATSPIVEPAARSLGA